MRTNLSFRPVLVILLGAALLLSAGRARAQSDLENALEQFGVESVTGYIQPMADLFGANMNAGFYHSAAIPTAGLTLSIELIGMGSVVSDDHKKYTANAPAGFSPATFQTATIFGEKGATISHTVDPTIKYSGSDGIIDASLFPLAVPQLRVGSIYGTELTVRLIGTPSIDNDAFPSTTLFGIGARHSVSQYMPVAPLDIAVGLFYSSFTVGDIIDFKGLSIGAQASKSFSVLSLYGGVAWEQSTMDLVYTSTVPGVGNVNIELDGDNSFRFTVGAGLSIAILHIFADANFGSITNFSGGIGVGF
jgi:hypothetical protein